MAASLAMLNLPTPHSAPMSYCSTPDVEECNRYDEVDYVTLAGEALLEALAESRDKIEAVLFENKRSLLQKDEPELCTRHKQELPHIARCDFRFNTFTPGREETGNRAAGTVGEPEELTTPDQKEPSLSRSSSQSSDLFATAGSQELVDAELLPLKELEVPGAVHRMSMILTDSAAEFHFDDCIMKQEKANENCSDSIGARLQASSKEPPAGEECGEECAPATSPQSQTSQQGTGSPPYSCHGNPLFSPESQDGEMRWANLPRRPPQSVRSRSPEGLPSNGDSNSALQVQGTCRPNTKTRMHADTLHSKGLSQALHGGSSQRGHAEVASANLPLGLDIKTLSMTVPFPSAQLQVPQPTLVSQGGTTAADLTALAKDALLGSAAPSARRRCLTSDSLQEEAVVSLQPGCLHEVGDSCMKKWLHVSAGTGHHCRQADLDIHRLAADIKARQDVLEKLIEVYEDWVAELSPPPKDTSAQQISDAGCSLYVSSRKSLQKNEEDLASSYCLEELIPEALEDWDTLSSYQLSEVSSECSSLSDSYNSENIQTVYPASGGMYRGTVTPCGTMEGYGQFRFIGNADAGQAGGLYLGEFEGGLMHGYGVFYFGNNGCYSGQWIRGRQQGFGKQVFENGTMCMGTFGKSGRLDGVGHCLYPTGDTYEGHFRDGVPHGNGYHVAAKKGSFCGNFAEGRRCGKGVYKFSNGDTYTGEFARDRPSGYGLYTTNKGEQVEGAFLKGKVHGWGIRSLPDGSQAAGKWHKGKLLWSSVLRPGMVYKELLDADAEGVDMAQEVRRAARHVVNQAEAVAVAARGNRQVTEAIQFAMKASMIAADSSKRAVRRANKKYVSCSGPPAREANSPR